MTWQPWHSSSGSLLRAAASSASPQSSPSGLERSNAATPSCGTGATRASITLRPVQRARTSLRGSAREGKRASPSLRAEPVGCRRTLVLAAPTATLLIMASLWPADASQAKPGQLYKKEGRSIYVVAMGDTLSEIARRFGTTVDILVEANKLESSLIVPGQQLWTPQTYTIQKGDTLNAIAKKYGTTVDEILKVNEVDDPNTIRAGDIMLLP